MTKWADYGISKVRYNADGTNIIKVLVHENKEDEISPGKEWARTQVINEIENGKTFVTILKNKNNEWNKGENVHIVTINHNKYIRTDNNQTSKDNLENLPAF